MPKHTMTAEEARQLFSYNPETGDLAWRVSPNSRAPVGRVIRTDNGAGYYHATFRGVRYYVHRLVWLISTGSWPEGLIDHIDGDPTNNRIENLRQASHAENTRNSARRRDNTSGFKGVDFYRRTGRYRARIEVDGRKLDLGTYDTPQEAHAAYCAAAKKLHGEFANTG